LQVGDVTIEIVGNNIVIRRAENTIIVPVYGDVGNAIVDVSETEEVVDLSIFDSTTNIVAEGRVIDIIVPDPNEIDYLVEVIVGKDIAYVIHGISAFDGDTYGFWIEVI